MPNLHDFWAYPSLGSNIAITSPIYWREIKISINAIRVVLIYWKRIDLHWWIYIS